MTVNLNLKPEVEAGLSSQGRARGLSLEAYLDRLLQEGLFVLKDGEQWVVMKPQAGRASDVLPTQALAIERARELTDRGEVDVITSVESKSKDQVPVNPIAHRPASRRSLAQLFADSPFKGLDMQFERNPDTGRPVNL